MNIPVQGSQLPTESEDMLIGNELAMRKVELA